MLGYEPPQPKLWKAVLGAAVIVFPALRAASLIPKPEEKRND